MMVQLPHALAQPSLALLEAALARSGPQDTVLLLDYDGTLAPIVADPHHALPERGVLDTLERLVARFPRTCVITGRSVDTIRGFLGRELADRLQLAASHGHDLAGPFATLAVGTEHLPALAAARDALRAALAGVPGADVEDNRFSVTVHYRNVPAAHVDGVKAAVHGYMTTVGTECGLLVRPGNCVLECRPAMAWDKGRAAALLVAAMGADRDSVTVVAIGDDLTDEDMFCVLAAPPLPPALSGADSHGATASTASVSGIAAAASTREGSTQAAPREPPPHLRVRGVPIIVHDDGAAAPAVVLGGDGAGGGKDTVTIARGTAAAYALRAPAEVRALLEALLAMGAHDGTGSTSAAAPPAAAAEPAV